MASRFKSGKIEKNPKQLAIRGDRRLKREKAVECGAREKEKGGRE